MKSRHGAFAKSSVEILENQIKFGIKPNFIVYLKTSMRLTNKKILEKFKRKNRGNISLTKAIDKLIKDIDENDWKNQIDLNKTEQMLTTCIVMAFTFSISIFIEP